MMASERKRKTVFCKGVSCAGKLKMSDLGFGKVSLNDAAQVPEALRHQCRTVCYDLKCKREPSLWSHPQQGDSSLVSHLH